MRRFTILLTVVLAFPLLAQQSAQDKLKARVDAHRGDFDYLLGDWEFTATSKEYGKFGGRWSAVRLGEGAVLDEYRVVGDDGETYYVSRTVRAYNAQRDHWELVSTEGTNGLQNAGTGRLEGKEMHIEQKFGVGTPNASTWRIRYFDIGPDHFSWSSDRSTDGGKTWTKEFQTIEARRIGPPRSITLTAAQK